MAKKDKKNTTGENTMIDSKYLHVFKNKPIDEARKFLRKVKKKSEEQYDKDVSILIGDEFDDALGIIHVVGFAETVDDGILVEISSSPYTHSLFTEIPEYLSEKPDPQIVLLTLVQARAILKGNGG